MDVSDPNAGWENPKPLKITLCVSCAFLEKRWDLSVTRSQK
jgi:hypothetical protein